MSIPTELETGRSPRSASKTARAFGQEDDITVLTITRLPIYDAVEAAVSLATS